MRIREPGWKNLDPGNTPRIRNTVLKGQVLQYRLYVHIKRLLGECFLIFEFGVFQQNKKLGDRRTYVVS
jgi:hypothetical protein